ncbi:MAG: heat-inducible transcription repressor HrcA [Pseudomonadales bacterium]|nr:heat-inducible transcription repressor HrcA [Pseudomonadales bacterium]
MSQRAEINEKSQRLLKTLVERYIAQGQPVGSKTLAQESGISVSPATVRNIMADLEDKGFVTSPHTSAGRVPTAKGYRFFVDTLLEVSPLEATDLIQLRGQLDPDWSTRELVQSASGILSDVTRMAGVVTIPRRDQVVMRHVEFLKLNDNRVLVILVLDDHEVQNRIIYTDHTYNDIQLKEAANYINQHYSGRSFFRIRQQLLNSMKSDQENMNSLMQTTLEVATKAFQDDENSDQPGDYVIAGQEKLVENSPTEALETIRNLFKAFSLKGDILHLLDQCIETDGVQLFIGQESGYELLDECTVVTSPYKVEGQLVGVLGVIGPTRMAYDRVIPIVDATARMLGAALDFSAPRNDS